MNNRIVVTFANGASSTPGVDIGGFRPIALRMSPGWTAASLTFDASEDGITYGPVFDIDGRELIVLTSATRYIALPSAPFVGARFLSLRSGTFASPVSQGAERDIVLITTQFIPGISRFE